LVASPSNGKLYLIGGLVGLFGLPTDQVWSLDPSSGVWTQKTSVPAPGIGATYSDGVELGGTIYLFGGYSIAGPHRLLWKYNVAADSWSRGQDLPSDNFGSAVAVVGGKIYIAYGSGLGLQTLQYDPVADSYQSLSPPPNLPLPYLVRAVTLNGEMHVFGGDLSQDAHVIYDPRTDTWRTGPSLIPGILEPAVGVIGGRAIVVGGYPVARTQIFDPATNAWSEGAPVSGSAQGFDYSEGASIGGAFHVVGGFNGNDTIQENWRLHLCQAGDLSSANVLPLVVDGNGTVAGVSNERTALVLDNVSGSDMQATCVLYAQNGSIDSSLTVSVAASEAKAIPDIVRVVRGRTGLQNFAGNLTIFGTEIFHAMGSLVANDTSDNAYEDGVPLSGHTAGFVPVIRSKDYKTQTVFSNLSSSTALLQLVVYPPEGGDAPAAASLVPIKPHATVSYLDIATQLGLTRGTIGQLSWSANQPLAVVARERLPNKSLSGFEPVRVASDASPLVTVPYIEDTAAFSTSLDLSNPGSSTADVTINFIDGTTGVVSSRDLQVEFNSAIPIPDIVRWVLRSTSALPTGQRGFLTIESPQGVTAHGRLIDRANNDPAVTDQLTALDSTFSPLVIRIEPFTGLLAKAASATLGEGGVGSGLTSTAASTAATVSRFAVSNPNDQPALVEITALNASGSAAGPPYVVTIPAKHQYFTENLLADMGLPVVFLGSVNVRSDSPVLVYNHRRTGDLGATVPVHGF
jgi:hypothetical protein